MLEFVVVPATVGTGDPAGCTVYCQEVAVGLLQLKLAPVAVIVPAASVVGGAQFNCCINKL